MDEPSLWNSDRRDRPRAHEIRTLIGCIKSKCEWYAIVYSTENIAQRGCAIKFMPMMNSDGKLVV